MALKRKTVGIIVALVIVALSGLVVVQSYMLRSAFVHKEQAFQRNVMAALGAVVQKLTTREMITLALEVDSSENMQATTSVVTYEIGDELPDTISLKKEIHVASHGSLYPSVWVTNDSIHYRIPDSQRVCLQVVDPVSGERRFLLDTVALAGEHALPLTDNLVSEGCYYWKFASDSITMVLHVEDGTPRGILQKSDNDVQRWQMVVSILEDLKEAEYKPIEERINQQELDSVIALNLLEAGIDLDHAYGVITGYNDSLRIAKPAAFAEELRVSDFKASLFPHDLFSEPAELVVYFPGRIAYLWRQMGLLVLPTAVLMLIIVGCFIYTIRTILRQRLFARLMIDFINNMTHEFKTPLSTVQLACDAINREEVLTNRTKVRHFNEMILGETRRMKNQADKILQMAVLEEGDYELNIEELDVHELITKATEAIRLRVERQQGSLECDFGANNHVMMADVVHLANIIHNLLDNACKYSPRKPKIRVVTKNKNGNLHIIIEDNGIGMESEDARRAFDKYFRVHHGNVHDVKGFGLGLSYVKLMIMAHGGTVSLQSRPQEGTLVELSFPISRLVD